MTVSDLCNAFSANTSFGMTSFVKAFGFEADPFREYVAENEPHIEAYAVRPPYFLSVADRAEKSASFLLFGRRGAGKSATRLTVFKEIWKRRERGEKTPLPVTMVDFSRILSNGGLKGADRPAFVREAAFLTIEAVLVWLTSLEEEERNTFVGAISDREQDLIVGLLKQIYFPVPEIGRQVSSRNALSLLNQAWQTKARAWVEKKWGPLSTIFSSVLAAFVKDKMGTSGNEEAAIKELLQTFGKGQGNDHTIALLQKLTEFVQIFGFTGVVVLIDKADETELTNQSAESTGQLLYPLLAHIQMLEIEDFGWIFFAWDKVRDAWVMPASGVRLDKIASSIVDWDVAYLEEMITRRLDYFSEGKVRRFGDLCDESVDGATIIRDLANASMISPRELIRLLDTIIREHDQLHAHEAHVVPLSRQSIETGVDKYVKDVIGTLFDEKTVNQFIRLERPVFTNKEVQAAFRVGLQTARNRITKWTAAGVVKLTGTRAAEGDAGGKPQNEYAIVDTQLARIVSRKLIEVHEAEESAGFFDDFEISESDDDLGGRGYDRYLDNINKD